MQRIIGIVVAIHRGSAIKINQQRRGRSNFATSQIHPVSNKDQLGRTRKEMDHVNPERYRFPQDCALQ